MECNISFQLLLPLDIYIYIYIFVVFFSNVVNLIIKCNVVLI